MIKAFGLQTPKPPFHVCVQVRAFREQQDDILWRVLKVSEQAGMLEFIGLKLSALRLRRERPEFFSLRHADHHSTAYNPMPEASSV